MARFIQRITLLFFLVPFAFAAAAGTVDTVSIFSSSMHKMVKCVVIRPDLYKQRSARFPVVYLLHGYGGNYNNCITRIPMLKDYADTYSEIIVCPDGGFSSWYFDSPVDPSYRYETHVAVEVVKYIDAHYKTFADKNHRAICGLSMGGHGALMLALHHPDVFGAAASTSGGMDLNDSRNKFDIASRIGDTIGHAGNWHDLSLVNMIAKYAGTHVKVLFDCGDRDIFIESNRRLHRMMTELKIPHDYTERPGEHNWDYWRNSIPYHLLFFRIFFDQSQ
jgi:S-formylglutathione hydrolase FrmB